MQLCSEILDSLKDGKFGAEGVSCADDYRRKCASHFEMSSLFSDSVPATAAASADDNSNQQPEEGDEVNSNNISAVSKGEQKTDKVTAATSTNKNSSHLNSKTVTTAS